MRIKPSIQRIDSLGRVLIPVDIRQQMLLEHKQQLEIYPEGDRIILKKKETECIFCGSAKATVELKGKYICSGCLKGLEELVPQTCT